MVVVFVVCLRVGVVVVCVVVADEVDSWGGFYSSGIGGKGIDMVVVVIV